MKTVIITPTVVGGDALDNLYRTTLADRYLFYLNSEEESAIKYCKKLYLNDNVDVAWFYENRGVAYCWNLGLRFAMDHDYIPIVVNDDIAFDNFESWNNYTNFIKQEFENPSIGCIQIAGYNKRINKYVKDHGYACFTLTKAALKTVGFFDEKFYPAYFEDMDYSYRLKLNNLKTVTAPDCTALHLGSSTIYSNPKRYKDHHEPYMKNEEYYIKKWGGPPRAEKYTIPFNRSKKNA